MRSNPSPLHTAAAVGAALALTLVACGGDDDDSSDSTTAPAATDAPADEGDDAADTGDAPVMQPSSISFDAQESDGTTITVATIDLPSPGFIAVHSDGGGSPGPVIGVSELLPAGTSSDVSVTLAEPLTGDSTLFPMVHIDTDGNGLYEFGTVDGADGPGLTADDDVAVVAADVSVTGNADDGGNADSPGITIADFAFSGVTEVAIGTTVVVTNDDGTAHTWSAVDDEFDSGTLEAGESFEFTFTEAGEFEYFCNFHPSMTGTIVVTG